MSTGYKISEKDGFYYLTLQIVGWVDIFTRKLYKDIVIVRFISA
jgi:putative transposase